MLPSIPASKIVNVLASVLGTGGTALALNTVVITDNSVYPIGQYSTAADVAAVWGYGSKEHTFALTYFAGYACQWSLKSAPLWAPKSAPL